MPISENPSLPPFFIFFFCLIHFLSVHYYTILLSTPLALPEVSDNTTFCNLPNMWKVVNSGLNVYFDLIFFCSIYLGCVFSVFFFFFKCEALLFG